MSMFEHDDSIVLGANIKVIGVGGGGNNAVNRMVISNIGGAEFVTINTDRMAISRSSASRQLVIGEKLTNGRGAGAKPEIGKRAAEESLEDIKNVLSGAEMVFVTAGMGGGTGTGAAPVVARVAQEMGILTIGIVTKPFTFEGKIRRENAESGIAELAQYVDSLIVIPNDKLKETSDQRITLANAFEMADDVLRKGVQSISELVNVPAYINLDFADVCTVMRDAGHAHMGVGAATGKDKAELAAREAISSPLLESSIKGARGILVAYVVSPDVGLEDIDLANTLIQNEADPDANIIWGIRFNEEAEDEIRITLVATGFDKKEEAEAAPEVVEPAPEAKPEVEEEDEEDDFWKSISVRRKK